MSQTATNVVIMPKPSDKNISTPERDVAGPGHRSPSRAGSAEKTVDKAGEGSFDSSSGQVHAISAEPSTEVFAVFGVEPEIQAYAMAKYSRSALSMKESLREISTQKAEKFLNTFYFQYGHRSIADLAHVAMAVERLSILAAIAVADEQRWDGQERSTRYQDFKKSGYFSPDFGADKQSQSLYRATIKDLFSEYESLSERMFQYLAGIKAKPEEMKQE